MYNNFLVRKLKQNHEQQKLIRKRFNQWTQNYHQHVQPELLDRYNQRINSFITKIQQNPFELEKFEPTDIKKEKEQYLKQKISEMSNKGGKIFKFRDAADFNSFFGEAERIQRQQNKILFEKKYGDSNMAYRSIASQSDYNPQLKNQFRRRQKAKEINPPMRYINKLSIGNHLQKRVKTAHLNQKNNNLKNSDNKGQQNDHNLARRSTSFTNSVLGNDDLSKSVNSIPEGSQSSDESRKNLKRFSVTMQNLPRQKKRQSSKSYFVGLTDIKQNSKDPHLKKTLHNILVKIGKTHPNPRDRALASNIQILSTIEN